MEGLVAMVSVRKTAFNNQKDYMSVDKESPQNICIPTRSMWNEKSKLK